jgi:hypothetical protein
MPPDPGCAEASATANAALTCEQALIFFSEKEGADEHVEVNAGAPSHQRIFACFDSVSEDRGATTPGRPAAVTGAGRAGHRVDPCTWLAAPPGTMKSG